MANFCLIPAQVNKFIQGLTSGDIDPGKLANMEDSESRREYLAKYVGDENAKQVNALFESKLLLKNQQKGMIDWAKATMGEKNPRLTDVVSKINKMQDILNPGDKQSFFQDLSSQRLGVDVDFDSAQKLVGMVKDIGAAKQEAISAIQAVGEKNAMTDPDTVKARMDYGIKKASLGNYISELKSDAPSTIEKITGDVLGATKYISQNADNPFMLRQNMGQLLSGMFDAAHGDTSTLKGWVGNFVGSWKQFASAVKGDDPLLLNKADIMSRPNALNGKYEASAKTNGLGVTSEEGIPQNPITNKIEQIPILGRYFKGMEAAFNGAALKTRADLLDTVIAHADAQGLDTLNKATMEPLGAMVSSWTGRGNIGKFEAISKPLNVALYSAKFLKSQFDTLMAPATYLAGKANEAITGTEDPAAFAKKLAAQRTLKIVTSLAGMYAVANIIKPGSAQLNPLESNFGKIKIGGNYFDPTFGMGTIVTLASRLATGKYMTDTGKVTNIYDPKFGQSNGLDVALQFFENKTSPVGGVALDFLRGQTFEGTKPTVGGEATSLVTPIAVKTFQDLRKTDESAANQLGTMILSGLGATASIPTTYPKKK